MPPQGTTATRIEVLERQVELLLREAAVRPVRDPASRRTYHGYWARTCAGEGAEYPTEESNPNTYWVKIVEASFDPADDDGSSERIFDARSSEGLIVARNAGSGYVPVDTLVRIEPSRVRGKKAFWWFYRAPAATAAAEARFRLTTALSVFGTANGQRQKWDGAAYVDDGDYPDPVTLKDYVGSASSGDVNDKCFAVEMADHSGVWEIVEIQQAGAAQEIVVFELDEEGGITVGMATCPAKVVVAYNSALEPDDPIIVRNYETHIEDRYRFRAPTGYRGVALKIGTGEEAEYLIVDMEEVVKNARIYFTCAQTVATTDASFNVTVTRLLGDADLILGELPEDPDPPLEIEVHNVPNQPADYVFTGANGTSVGLAEWDHRLLQWEVVWITCPPADPPPDDE